VSAVTSYPPAPPNQPGQPGQPGYGYAPNHPRATLALVLGILGVVLCNVLAPFAWAIGGTAVREIDASGGRYGGRGSAKAGQVLGIIGTVLLVIGVLVAVLALVGVFSFSGSTSISR
jgi:uncharacterized membrane protein YjgN (DUF898 family)